MASSETLKSEVAALAQRMNSLKTTLDNSAANFRKVSERAQGVLKGSSQSATQQVLSEMQKAEAEVKKASQAVQRAATEASAYASQKV